MCGPANKKNLSLSKAWNLTLVGQIDQIDQIDHDLDHLDPSPPLRDVVKDPYRIRIHVAQIQHRKHELN